MYRNPRRSNSDKTNPTEQFFGDNVMPVTSQKNNARPIEMFMENSECSKIRTLDMPLVFPPVLNRDFFSRQKIEKGNDHKMRLQQNTILDRISFLPSINMESTDFNQQSGIFENLEEKNIHKFELIPEQKEKAPTFDVRKNKRNYLNSGGKRLIQKENMEIDLISKQKLQYPLKPINLKKAAQVHDWSSLNMNKWKNKDVSKINLKKEKVGDINTNGYNDFSSVTSIKEYKTNYAALKPIIRGKKNQEWSWKLDKLLPQNQSKIGKKFFGLRTEDITNFDYHNIGESMFEFEDSSSEISFCQKSY